jgi:UDP-N-acetylglucosamine 4,6-dehydratase/5-epimerase
MGQAYSVNQEKPESMSRILITGGTGTFGQAATARFLADGHTVTIFSRDEQKQEKMAQLFPSAQFFLGDVRDPIRLHMAMRGRDIVVHAAALKIVAKCEFDPLEAAKTNVGGTSNIVSCALNTPGMKRVLFLSTDKAVDPVNLYGATKKVAEHLILSAANLRGSIDPIFSVMRYGNVWNSRGSVVERWKQALDRGEECILTDPEMTRFFMTAEEAVELATQALLWMSGGDIFIPRLEAYRLADLKAAFLAVHPKARFAVTGHRKGEKIHESLMTSAEKGFSHDGGDYFIIGSAPSSVETSAGFGAIKSKLAPRMKISRLVQLIKETANG